WARRCVARSTLFPSTTLFRSLLQDKGYSAIEASQIFGAFGISLVAGRVLVGYLVDRLWAPGVAFVALALPALGCFILAAMGGNRSEEHTSELQSRENPVCRLL